MKTGCFGRAEIESFIPPKDSVLVCIHDPESEYPKVARNIQGWRFISFHSFWDLDKNEFRRKKDGTMEYYENQMAATEKDFAHIKDTLDSFRQGYNIFASCEAGISRSAAVREFLVRRGYTYLNEAQKNRMVHPNAYILADLERLDRGLNKGEQHV